MGVKFTSLIMCSFKKGRRDSNHGPVKADKKNVSLVGKWRRFAASSSRLMDTEYN